MPACHEVFLQHLQGIPPRKEIPKLLLNFLRQLRFDTSAQVEPFVLGHVSFLANFKLVPKRMDGRESRLATIDQCAEVEVQILDRNLPTKAHSVKVALDKLKKLWRQFAHGAHVFTAGGKLRSELLLLHHKEALLEHQQGGFGISNRQDGMVIRDDMREVVHVTSGITLAALLAIGDKPRQILRRQSKLRQALACLVDDLNQFQV
mmetsp:Transcript_119072/g.282515  ORF Transcript_119072/g.282515 Transcript_119072/m.282515 type:complete len:205 (-) Transcript_119072:9-623(-)